MRCNKRWYPQAILFGMLMITAYSQHGVCTDEGVCSASGLLSIKQVASPGSPPQSQEAEHIEEEALPTPALTASSQALEDSATATPTALDELMQPAAAAPAVATPGTCAAAWSSPQQCSELSSDDEVFDCCYKERLCYKTLLGERGVQVVGETEEYGPWGSAAKEEVKMLFDKMRDAEKQAGPGKPFTVCETGLNWGGTSHIFLCGSRTHSTVLSFDIERERSIVPNATLRERYGSRLTVTIGDSTVVLANLASSATPPDCNFVFVDGGHSKPIAKADLINFGKMAQPGTPVVADDCFAEGSYHPRAGVGPKEAFNEAISENLVTPQPSVRFTDINFRAACVGAYAGPR